MLPFQKPLCATAGAQAPVEIEIPSYILLCIYKTNFFASFSTGGANCTHHVEGP